MIGSGMGREGLALQHCEAQMYTCMQGVKPELQKYVHLGGGGGEGVILPENHSVRFVGFCKLFHGPILLLVLLELFREYCYGEYNVSM